MEQLNASPQYDTENLSEEEKMSVATAKLQLDLFTMLDGDKYQVDMKKRYSNSVTSIDLMPRYFRGVGARVATTKIKDKQSMKFENNFNYRGEECVCTVTPALIEEKDRKTKVLTQYFAFPSDAEELIEKIIFMIASIQSVERRNIGGNIRHVVTFSLYQIKQFLIQMKSEKSYSQIRQSLMIIRDSNTRISKQHPNDPNKRIEVTKDVWADSAIEVSGNGRGRDKCYIAFSDFVVKEILNLNYRQVLFSRFTAYNSTFSRYLDLYLSNIWTNANIDKKQPISLMTVMESFGKANKSIITKRRDMRGALKDLVERGVIKYVPSAVKEKTGPNEEDVDYIYPLEPTDQFVEEIIKANAKNRGLNMLNNEIIEGKRTSLPSYVKPIYQK